MKSKYLFLLCKHIVSTTTCIILFIFTSNSISAQQSVTSLSPDLSEKIYLQLNNKVYTTNETIWFKSIVTIARLHELSNLSGVLYVELISPNKKIVEKKILKINKGIGDGYFELNTKYEPGTYLIRAYTQWNKNFGKDFIFKEYIQIFPSKGIEQNNAITNIIVENKEDNTRWLKANLNPFSIDSLHKKKITLYITSENNTDSLVIKKNRENKFIFNYPLPKGSQFVSLQIKTKNNISQAKSVVVDDNFLDFQFFPESGQLVNGIPNRIGFKVLNAKGKGKFIKGIIVDEQDKIISSFKSNKLGMGSFKLYHVDAKTNYYAKITSESKNNISLKYQLPKIDLFGTVLSVRNRDDKISIKITSNDYLSDSLYIKTSCRGMDYFEIKGRLKNGYLSCSLFKNKLPEGVITISLLDKNKEPIAERNYFNKRLGDRLQISLSTEKKDYTQREQTKLQIKTINKAGKVVKANTSLLVFNQNNIKKSQNSRQNILSYFLLNSDLRGVIENPTFYFEKNKNRDIDLDNLLLTQGWSKYSHKPNLNKIIHKPENHISVSGYVKSAFSAKRKNNVKLSLVAFGKPKSFNFQTTDSLGKFKFDINDSYTQYLKILIQTANKTGKKKNYTVKLDKKKSPKIAYNTVNPLTSIDSVTFKYIKKNIERKHTEDKYKMYSDVNQLNEVLVKGYALTPDRVKVAKRYGKPDVVIEGKDIRAKEKKWSYGLYSVLMFSFPNDIEVQDNPHRALKFSNDTGIENGSSTLYAQVINPSFPTLIIVDGIPVLAEDYSSIPGIPPSEVKSFEIIKTAKGFLPLYLSLFPNVNPLEAPKFGHIIAIYTYAGKGLHGAKRSVGITQARIPVFSTVREFYAPKHKDLTTTDWRKPDLRTLIHWQPQIVTNTSGKTFTSYYNADTLGETKIIVEAISENGEIGYEELIYNVKKSN